MTEIDKEIYSEKYISFVTIDKTEIILSQMKNSVCKIENKNGNGTGFFCKIYNLKLLITNNHIIDDEIIKENNSIRVRLFNNKIKKDIKIKYFYTSKLYDTTIIEIADIISVKNNKEEIISNDLQSDDIILEEDSINCLKKEEDKFDEDIIFLEIDDEIFLDKVDMPNKSLYIIQYPKSINEYEVVVSYGIFKEINKKYDIHYYCNTDKGSSGSPIINLSTQKIIGIHKEGYKKYNYNSGTLLSYPINEYLKEIRKDNKKNEIKLEIKIEKKDINKNIYFLENKDEIYVNHHHKNSQELNNLISEIFINNIKTEYKNSFRPDNEGIYKIKIKFNNKEIKDCSYMFCGCSNLAKIDLSYFDTKNVTNMSYMFYGCSNLTNLDLSSFVTKNVINMRYMFYDCFNLTNLDLSSFDTKNVIDKKFMFFGCNNLKTVKLNNISSKINEELSFNVIIINQFGNMEDKKKSG